MSKHCLNLSDLEQFATALADGVKAELYLTPKPGLVDLHDCGSHGDLSLELMGRSCRMLREYLDELAVAIYLQQPFVELQKIGLRAEQQMLQELGSNCHRGGIFLTGLLLLAFAECGSDEPDRLSSTVAKLAQRHFQQARRIDSNGQQARSRYQVGGVIAETLKGLPGVFQVALPCLLANREDLVFGSYLALARLMRTCEDTTTLHRVGQTGLARLRRAGARLERELLQGDAPESLLWQLNEDFRAINLTMGGVADLLGLTFGYLNFILVRCRTESFSAVIPRKTFAF